MPLIFPFAMTLLFEVSGLGGCLCRVSVDAGGSLLDLQTAIQQETGLEPRSFRLLHDLQELREAGDMAKFQPGAEAALTLLRRSPEQTLQLKKLGEATVARVWLRNAPEAARGDREIVLAAVARSEGALCYANEELKGDREVVLKAVAQDGCTLEYAGEELKRDRDVVLAAVARSGRGLRHASEDLRRDREVVLVAVAQDGYALQYASERLKADSEVVLAAVGQDGYALQYASEELQNDVTVVLVAVSQDGHALRHASAERRRDRKVVLAAVARDGQALAYAAPELRSDPEVAMRAAQQSSSRQVLPERSGEDSRAAAAMKRSRVVLSAVQAARSCVVS